MERNNDEAGNQNKRGRDGSEPPEGDENKRRKTDDVPTPPPVNNLDLWGQWIPTLALNKIFQNLVDAEGPLPALCRLGAVSRLWNDVSRDPNLVRRLDLSPDWITKEDKVLIQIMDAWDLSQLKELNLSRWESLSESNIQMIADSCPKLNSVTLSETAVSDSALAYLVSKCLLLTKIDLSAMTSDAPCGSALGHLLDTRGNKLQSLNLASNSLKSFDPFMKMIARRCSDLRILNLSNVRFTAEVVMFDVELIQTVCTHLQVLDLSNTAFEISNSSPSEQFQSPGFPFLLELKLRINECHKDIICHVSNNFLKRLLKTSHGLLSLDISGCTTITCDCLQGLQMTDLEHLYLSDSPLAKYEGIKVVFTKWCHSLVQLDVSYNMYPGMLLEMVTKQLCIDPVNTALQVLDLKGTNISTSRIKAILELFPRLDCLKLNACQGLKRALKREYAGTDLLNLRNNITTIVEAEKDPVSTARDLSF